MKKFLTNRDDEPVRLLPALTVVYLCLPAILFFWGWVRLRVSLVALFFLVSVMLAASWEAVRAAKRKTAAAKEARWQQLLRMYLPALLLITLWVSISGAGGMGPQTTDLDKSTALLKDLIRRDWPLRLNFDGVPTPIVYYMAYYLLPAWVGRGLGWLAANRFWFIWTLLGTLLAFAWFVQISTVKLRNRGSRLLLLAGIFMLAGGMDIIGDYVLLQKAIWLNKHIEWWASLGNLQLSSNSTLLFWVPQHVLPAWLLIGLVASCILEEQNLKYIGMALAASILWSPFATLGVLPYLAVLAVMALRKENRRHAFNPASLFFNIGAIYVGGIAALFISANRFNFDQGLMWEFVQGELPFAARLAVFWLIEVGMLAIVISLLLIPRRNSVHRAAKMASSQAGGEQPETWRKSFTTHWAHNYSLGPRLVLLFGLSMLVLTILPIYKFGEASDLLMRGSIPALFILWALSAKLSLDASLRIRVRRSFEYALLLLVMFIGFMNATNDIMNRVIHYRYGPPTWASVKKSQVVEDMALVQQRKGDLEALFYRYLSK